MKDTSKAEMIWTADVTESAIVEGKRKRKTLFRYTPGGEVPLNRKRDELGSSYEAREESNDSRIHDNDESEEQSSGKSFAAGQLATQAPLSVQKKGKSAKDFGENVCQNVDSDDQEFASKYKPKNKRRKTRGKKDRRTCPVCKRVFTSPYGRDYHVCKYAIFCLLSFCICNENFNLSFDTIPLILIATAKRVCIPTNETIKIGTPLGTLEPGMEFVTKWGIARVLSDSRAKPTGEPVEGATALVKAWKSRLIKNELRRKEEYKTISTHSLARRKRLQELYERERKQQHSITAAIKNTTQKQVLKAYFGTLDLEGLNDRDFPPLANTFQSEPSPIETNSSEPYRIVECILIPDQRAIADYGVAIDENSDDAVFEMVERHLDSEHVKASLGSASPTRLFLQRRELTERYYADEHVYVCNRCGKVVKTKDGARYHAKTKKSCTRGPSKVDFLADYQKSLEAINRRADRLIAQQDAGTKVPVKKKAPAEIPKIKGAEEARTSPHNPRKKKKVRGADLYGTATQLTQEMPTVGTAREIFLAAVREVNVGATATVHATAAESKDTTVRHAPQSHERLKKQEVAKKKRIWQPKKKRVLAYYPQVWRSLGFKVVPRKRNAIRVSFFGKQRSGRPSYEMQPFRAENIPTDDSDVLNKVILDMKDELAKLNESELGSYYPSVWKVLGFNRPRKVKKELVSLPPEPGSLSPKAPETEFVPAPPHFAYSEPIVIDVSVLAGEVDSGRYPSCKRHTDEQKNDESFHHNACSICKDDRGILFKCDFCKHVNHLECIRSRFIVKDPEPHDDFMCNKCIQGLLAKRRRAEKRRLGAVTKPGVCQQDDLQNPALDAQLSADQPEAGKEIEFLVAHAQNVEDILELVEDSQSRLQQLVKTANMNDLRRGMLTL